MKADAASRRILRLVLVPIAATATALALSGIPRTVPAAAEGMTPVVTPTLITTVPVGVGPAGVGVNTATNRVYVANGFSNTVSVIDGASNTVVATVPVGSGPSGAGVNPTTNRVYVANIDSETVSAIDGTSYTVVATVPVGSGPGGVGVNPTTNHVYVANALSSSMSVIDGASNAVIATVPNVGVLPTGLGVNPATNQVYVTNAGGNTISVIDGTSNMVVATVPVGVDPGGLGVNPTTNRVYVTNVVSNTVSVIDGASNTVITTIPVGSGPNWLGVNPTTNRVYVTNGFSDTVSVIDGTSNTVVATVKVGVGPAGLAVNPTTSRVYVSNAGDNTVSVIVDGPPSDWALPYPAGTSASIGPLGLHGDNFSSIQDDSTQQVYRFSNPTATDSLDFVLEPEITGTATIPTTAVGDGTVLAVWSECEVVLVDHSDGTWAEYLHMANIPVKSGDAVTSTSIIGYPTTIPPPKNSRCGPVESTAEHVHLAFAHGSDWTRLGSYIPMLGQSFCGYPVAELNNDLTKIILRGLTQTKDQLFTVPACG